jgi:hypothetical protein
MGDSTQSPSSPVGRVTTDPAHIDAGIGQIARGLIDQLRG